MWRAQALQPGRRRFRLVRLGAQQHPVDRLGLFRLAQDGKRQFDHTARPIEREPSGRPTHAGDDVVTACRGQASGGAAADAAEADDGDIKTALS